MKTDDTQEDSATWLVDYNQAESSVPSSLYNLLSFILNENLDVSDIQLLSKIFIDSDFCHNYLHTLYLFESL